MALNIEEIEMCVIKRLFRFVAFSFSIYALGCGSDDGKVPQITINVPANANLIQLLNTELKSYEKDNNVRIKLIPFSGQEKLYAMMAAGKPPDIFYTNTVVRDQLAAEGLLLDLRKIAGDDPFVQRIHPEFIRRGESLDGGWYQFCDWTYTFGIYYNKDIFDRYGVSYPDSSWDWRGMLERAKRLTRDAGDSEKKQQYGIFIAKHFFSAIELMAGARYQPNELFFDLSPESQNALRLYLDLIYKEKVMPELKYVQAQGMQMAQMLNTGRVAMVAEAVPNLDFITSLKVNWDVAPFPQIENNPRRYFRSASGGLSISKTCQYPKAAWELIKWLVTKSPYNTPNPVLKDARVVSGWEEKYPVLSDKDFARVWQLSEQFDGGDYRDFVRYFSWSSNVILEQLSPKMDLLFDNQLSVSDLLKMKESINQKVIRELKIVANNKSLKPEFREAIRKRLHEQDIN